MRSDSAESNNPLDFYCFGFLFSVPTGFAWVIVFICARTKFYVSTIMRSVWYSPTWHIIHRAWHIYDGRWAVYRFVFTSLQIKLREIWRKIVHNFSFTYKIHAMKSWIPNPLLMLGTLRLAFASQSSKAVADSQCEHGIWHELYTSINRKIQNKWMFNASSEWMSVCARVPECIRFCR